jgi:hypothetical protein
MGFWREIGRPGAAIALLVTGAGGTAEPAEPLTVTQLGDPESELQISTASSNIGSPDRDIGNFSRAVSEAVRTQQQSIEVRCQSANKGTGPVATRWAWEARCRYQRY